MAAKQKRLGLLSKAFAAAAGLFMLGAANMAHAEDAPAPVTPAPAASPSTAFTPSDTAVPYSVYSLTGGRFLSEFSKAEQDAFTARARANHNQMVAQSVIPTMPTLVVTSREGPLPTLATAPAAVVVAPQQVAAAPAPVQLAEAALPAPVILAVAEPAPIVTAEAEQAPIATAPIDYTARLNTQNIQPQVVTSVTYNYTPAPVLAAADPLVQVAFKAPTPVSDVVDGTASLRTLIMADGGVAATPANSGSVLVTETTASRPLIETVQAAVDEHPEVQNPTVVVADAGADAPETTAPSVEVSRNNFNNYFSPRVVNAFYDASERTGIRAEYFAVKALRESSGSCSARASTSSASGLNQFTDQTWLAMFKMHGAEIGHASLANAISQGSDGRYRVSTTAARRAIMARRMDCEDNQYMAAQYVIENAVLLAERGIENPNSYQAYEAHFLGPIGAIRIEAAPSSVRASSVLPRAARANRSMFGQRSVAGFRAFVAARLDNAAELLGISKDDLAAPVFTTIHPRVQLASQSRGEQTPRYARAEAPAATHTSGPRPYAELVAEGWGEPTGTARVFNASVTNTANDNALQQTVEQPPLHNSVLMDQAMGGRRLPPAPTVTPAKTVVVSELFNPALIRALNR